MAELPDEVMPGELITSEWVNSLLAKIGELDAQVQQLSGSIPAGSVMVPNVFGKPFGEARQIISLPALQLALGNVFDSNGASINKDAAASLGLTVIGQYPVPGARAMPGSAVNLLVAGSGSATPPPSLVPMISGFSNEQTAVDELVDIIGANFVMPITANQVTFKGVPAPVLSGDIMALTVRVPTGITGVPTSGTTGVLIPVNVVTPHGQASGQHTIMPPLGGGPPPSITLPLIPSIPAVNSLLTINGANFSANVQQNIIHFDTLAVPAATATTSKLTVTVPNGVISQPGAKAVELIVEVKSGTGTSKMSNPIKVTMQRG
jgi:hypothetical protein